mgnify:CR=1 FL=1
MNILNLIKRLIKKVFLSEEVHYLVSGDALPKPLGNAEEQLMLMRLCDGDGEAKKQLIEHNLRLVVYIARKFDNTGIDLDDLISIGTIGLIKAINSFNLDKKIKLATFASRCIENEILMYLRRIAKTKGEVSFDEPLNVDWEGNELLLSDILGTETDGVSRQIESTCEKQILAEALRKLNKREKEIMVLRFGLKGDKEFTQKEVADLLGISQSYISRLEKKIVLKLRKEIKRAEAE